MRRFGECRTNAIEDERNEGLESDEDGKGRGGAGDERKRPEHEAPKRQVLLKRSSHVHKMERKEK
jgi:hypothetical protein